MKKQSFANSVIQVTTSNILVIIAGIIAGFILPKMISVEDYGWYKTFTLYSGYVGLIHLGLIDGIVLKYGASDYESMDRKTFRSYFRWFILINSIFGACLLILSIAVEDYNVRFICMALAIYTILTNCTGYFQQISQITQRFKEYSIRKTLYSFSRIVVLGILYLWGINGSQRTYIVYLVLFLIADSALTIWYLHTYSEIICGPYLKLSKTRDDIKELIKTGFPLLFANLCSTLILSLDRQFVSVLFPTETYAKYAFAYNMLSLVTVATSAISTVIYPTLKRTNTETLKQTYGSLIGILNIIVLGAVAMYFPLCVFVEWFLPKYTESLPIFRIVFPGLALSSSISVVMHNYYKTLGKSLEYFKKSIVVLIVSGLANAIAYFVFRSTASISIASIVTMVFWYVYVEELFRKEYQYNSKRNLLYLFSMMALFYAISAIKNYYIGFVVYFVAFCIITWCIHKKTITVDLKRILSK